MAVGRRVLQAYAVPAPRRGARHDGQERWMPDRTETIASPSQRKCFFVAVLATERELDRAAAANWAKYAPILRLGLGNLHALRR